ncbi:MAG: hypothetical protein CML18_03980 [Pusillimonas sp.]|nr:hypothetical protein [Pusillimonas sp.]
MRALGQELLPAKLPEPAGRKTKLRLILQLFVPPGPGQLISATTMQLFPASWNELAPLVCIDFRESQFVVTAEPVCSFATFEIAKVGPLTIRSSEIKAETIWRQVAVILTSGIEMAQQ